jgi:hypothetical protein
MGAKKPEQINFMVPLTINVGNISCHTTNYYYCDLAITQKIAISKENNR